MSMYDTVFFRLAQDKVQGVDFLTETSCYLDNVAEHTFGNGSMVVTGSVNGLKVSLNENTVKVKDGSLCKYYLGDNFQTMGRGDTQRAIEKLSDTLHLPMNEAVVTRLDIAQNLIMKHPTEVYLNHLGILKYAVRLEEPNGVYYSQNGGRLAFYDKNREQKAKNEPIPELYNGRNVLRYEQRYTKRIARKFQVEEVTGGLLYDEAFYMKLLNGWRDAYKQINKINDIVFNFEAMKTKQQLYRMGVLSLIEQVGGQTGMIAQIGEAQKRGELTKKQAYDLRQTVIDVCKVRDGLTIKSEVIEELDRKVCEAVRFYR